MLCAYVRSSSYTNYDYCEMAFFITYVLGHRGDSNKRAEFGTIVHKALEILASLKKFQQDNPKKKFLEIKDDVAGKVKVHKDKFLLEDFVDEVATLSTDAYAEKSKYKWDEKDSEDIHDLIFMILNYNDGQFDPRYRDVLDPEPHFDIPIEEDWAKYEYNMPDGTVLKGRLSIKGTIDLVTKIDDETIEVVDWKTGRRKDWATGEIKDFNKLENDPQLLLYFYAISKLYPEYPNRIMSIFFCKNPDGKIDLKPFSMAFGKADEQRFLGMLRKRYEEIKNNESPKPLREDRSHWKCTKLCHFYKNNWPGTNTPMCIKIGESLNQCGMDQTVKDYTKKDFSIGHYEAPG